MHSEVLYINFSRIRNIKLTDMIVTLAIYHFKVIERSGLKGPAFDGYVMRSADQNFSAIIATEITKVCLLKNIL